MNAPTQRGAGFLVNSTTTSAPWSGFAKGPTDGTAVYFGTGQQGTNWYAFAALREDGSVVTWGHADHGGDSSAVADRLHADVASIHATRSAFAALKQDGSVVTWGSNIHGGDSSLVAGYLTDGVSRLFSNEDAFAALKADGSVVSWRIAEPWSHGLFNGVSQAIAEPVIDIFATSRSFIALKADGTVTAWGESGVDRTSLEAGLNEGFVSLHVANMHLSALRSDGTVFYWNGLDGETQIIGQDLVSVFATTHSFAGLTSTGGVVAWGAGSGAINGSAAVLGDAAPLLQTGVVKIVPAGSAFAALKDDGSVVTWGSENLGGDPGHAADQLRSGVVDVFGAGNAFFALKDDGSAVAWGNGAFGGAIYFDEMQTRLEQGVVDVRGNSSGFAVLTAEGAVATWGQTQGAVEKMDVLQSDVVAIYANAFDFAALKSDGSVVTWGPAGSGGDASVADQLTGGIVGLASPFGTPFETGLGREPGTGPGIGPAPEPPAPAPELPDPSSPTVHEAGALVLISDRPWDTHDGRISTGGTAEVAVRHADTGALLMTLNGQTQVDADTLSFSGTVRAAAPSIAEPMMQGVFTLDLDTLQTSSLRDSRMQDSFSFGSDFFELEVSAIRLTPNAALFAADLHIDQVFRDGFSTKNSPFFVGVNDSTYWLEPAGAGRRFFEDEPLSVSFDNGANLEFTLSDAWVYYDNFERNFYLGGKGEAKWGGVASGTQLSLLEPPASIKKVEIDLVGDLIAEESIIGTRGDKFVRIALQGDGLIDRLALVGEIKYQAIPTRIKDTGLLTFREVVLSVDTIEKTFGGSFEAEVSFLRGATVTGAVAANWDPFGLESLSVGLDNLNRPIGVTGFFVQGGSIGLDNISARTTSDSVLELNGAVKLSLGPQIIGLRPALEFEVTGSWSERAATLAFEAIKTGGSLLPSWAAAELLQGGKSDHPLVASLTSKFGVKPDELLDFQLFRLAADLNLNFTSNHASFSGTAEALNGAFSTQARVNISAFDSRQTWFSASLRSEIEMPKDVPIFGGSRVESMIGVLKTTNSDFIEAYARADLSFWGISRGTAEAGFRLHTDGSYEVLNARNLPLIGSWELAPSQDIVVLSARWENPSADVELVVILPDGTRLRESDLAAHDSIVLLAEYTTDTLRSVAIHRPEAGIWDIEMLDPAGMGEITYDAHQLLEGAEGIIRSLNHDAAADRLQVTYDLTLGDAEAATLGFQFADEAGAEIGIELLSLDLFDSAQGLVADIDLSALAPGDYHLLLRTAGEGSVPVLTAHDSPITVTGAADLAILADYQWNAATASKAAVFTVTNEGTRLSGQARLELEVPAPLLGGELTSGFMQITLGQLAPGEVVRLAYDLGRAVVDPAARLIAQIETGGHDADILNNTATLTPVRARDETTIEAWVNHQLPAEMARLELQGGAALDGVGNAGDNHLLGNTGNNRLQGMGGDNLFLGGGGDDVIIGGNGHDLAVYRAAREHYDIHTDRVTGVTTVTDRRDAGTTPDHDGTDTLTNVETLRFVDIDVTLAVETVITVVDRSGMAMTDVAVHAAMADGSASEIGITGEAGQVFHSLAAGGEIWLTGWKPYQASTDGTITATNALDVLRLAVGLSPGWGPASPLDFIAADINQDGQVTATDALDVLRAAVGLQSTNQPRWLFLDSEADLTGINRSNTVVDEGILFDPVATDLTGLSMTGVLLGNMQEHP